MEVTPKQDRLFRLLFFLVLFTGLCLRAYQYLMGRSLWEDETHLALNFMSHSYPDLLKPLDYIQGAPILFLFFVKTGNLLFGYGELAFHFVPFLASVLTLPLIYYILLALSGNRLISILGFLLFSLNITLIYFSSELKPYAVDVSASLLLMYLAVSTNSYVASRRNKLLLLAGCLCLLVSLSAFILLFCIVCILLLRWYKNKAVNRKELLVMACWAIVFLINYFLFIYRHPSTMQQTINYASSFCPANLLSCEFITFLNKSIDEIFFSFIFRLPHNCYAGFVVLFLFVIAVAHLIKKKNYTLLIITCLPIALHLSLSALKFYPFVYRLILYLVPSMMMLLAIGIYVSADFLAKKTHAIIGLIAGLFFCSFFIIPTVTGFPLWEREIKPAISFVNDSIPAGEHIYLLDPIHAYMYYEVRGFAKKPLYRGLPWDMDTNTFQALTAAETAHFVLFYNDFYQFGYGNVIADLKAKHRIIKTFCYKGFEVSEVTPPAGNTPEMGVVKTLDHTAFDRRFLFEEEKIIALWSGDTAISKPVELAAGKYTLSVMTRGTPAAGVYPHNQVFINGQKTGEFFAPQTATVFDFKFNQETTASVKIKVLLDNDLSTDKEDRNTFILYFKIKKQTDQN